MDMGIIKEGIGKGRISRGEPKRTLTDQKKQSVPQREIKTGDVNNYFCPYLTHISATISVLKRNISMPK